MSYATAIAAVSALAAVGSFVVYLYVVRRSDRDSAREEALALAETRGQIIDALRSELKSLEQRQRRVLARCEKRQRALQAELLRTNAEAREQAYQAQRFYAAVLADLLSGLERDLERRPPDVTGALRRIREQFPREKPEANAG